MKKLLLIVIAAVLAVSLFAISAFAAESSIELTNIDFVCLVNSSGAIIENVGKGTDLGNIKVEVDAGAAYIWLIGWHYPTKEPVDFGYQTDDGEIVYGQMNCAYNEGTSNVIASWGDDWALHADWVRTFNGYVPIQAGAHEVKLYVKYTDGNSKVIYTTKYSTDDSNIALGKPVFIDLYNVGSYGAPYWDPSFLTDGTKWLFNADLANPVPLGWYGAYAANAAAKFYVDLQGIYDLSSVNVHAMGFDNASIPKAFTVYVSADGINWESIGKAEDVTSAVDSADPFKFSTNKRARSSNLLLSQLRIRSTIRPMRALQAVIPAESAAGQDLLPARLLIPSNSIPMFRSTRSVSRHSGLIPELLFRSSLLKMAKLLPHATTILSATADSCFLSARLFLPDNTSAR
jgi:hypothetical protein